MLSNTLFEFLERILLTRPILRPRPIAVEFPDGYQPIHLKCYRTARKVQQLMGYPVIAGVSFLDKERKLYPWPHMVNAVGARLGDGMVDASPPVLEPSLGFFPILYGETGYWNEVTAAYVQIAENHPAGPCWGDANADRLTQLYLPRLLQVSSAEKWRVEDVAIPECVPEL